MKVNQLTPLNVSRRKTVDQAIAILRIPMSGDIDAGANILSVAAVARDDGFMAKIVRFFGQTVHIPESIRMVRNDEEVLEGFTGPWPENMEITGLVRSGAFPFQTGDISVSSADEGHFGSQVFKIKISGTAKVAGNIRSMRRVLDGEKLEKSFHRDILVLATALEAWFATKAVEGIVDAAENSGLPQLPDLQSVIDPETDWTFEFKTLSVQSVSYSKEVNQGLAAARLKQQQRQEALDAIENGIQKIVPGQPHALKAVFAILDKENRDGDITVEELEQFKTRAKEAETVREEKELSDKKAQAETAIRKALAEADEPEDFFGAINSMIIEAKDLFDESIVASFKDDVKKAFVDWVKTRAQNSELQSDFDYLRNVLVDYKTFFTEKIAMELQVFLTAEISKRREEVSRREKARIESKTFRFKTGAEGLAAIIENPGPEVMVIANALAVNPTLVEAAKIAFQIDMAERSLQGARNSSGNMNGMNEALPSYTFLLKEGE